MKINMPFLSCFTVFILFSIAINAQSFVSLSTGVSTDINNTNKSFYHIPVSLQWKSFSQKKSPVFLEFDYDIPFIHKGMGNAYTLNPSLPEEITLQQNIQPYIFTVSIGFRIHLYTNKKNNSFYLNLLPFGICNQNFKVKYKNYDKKNYEVLNPDVSQNKTGVVTAMEAVYNFHKRKQDMTIMLHLQNPLLRSTGDYLLLEQQQVEQSSDSKATIIVNFILPGAV